MAGEEVHEVAVGPVHAGIIEPGHFRFQCHGEHVFHLEISLGYQHRGVERALVAGPGKRTIHLMETLCGDTSIGHSTAYCEAIEALSGAAVSARAQVLRGIALELERLANHTGDLGALAGDVGYLPTAAYCGRIRGDFLNLTAMLCGSRFGRGMIRPGGVGFDLRKASGRGAEATIGGGFEGPRRRGRAAVGCAISSGSLRGYWDDIPRNLRRRLAWSVLRPVHAESSATSGRISPAAFSDSRRSRSPNGIAVTSLRGHGCDGLKFSDRGNSFASSSARSPRDQHYRRQDRYAPDNLVVSLIEGWRGEICHVAITDPEARFAHYKIVDPSFHNWMGLAIAMRDQQISDFPLCNKSFNLSYCGHDL